MMEGAGLMGCDFHGTIEYKETDKIEWKCFAQIYLTRDYTLFAHLAGARNRNNKIQPVIPARGLPECISWGTREIALVIIEGSEKFKGLPFGESVTASRAEKYVRQYGVQWYEEGYTLYHVDYHHYSWLDRAELESVLHRANEDMEVAAIVAAMVALESNTEDVRFVFWFDN